MTTVHTPNCPHCGKPGAVEVLPEAFDRWARGAFVQDAFPDLGSALREQLMTGIHPECWDAFMGPEPEE